MTGDNKFFKIVHKFVDILDFVQCEVSCDKFDKINATSDCINADDLTTAVTRLASDTMYGLAPLHWPNLVNF